MNKRGNSFFTDDDDDDDDNNDPQQQQQQQEGRQQEDDVLREAMSGIHEEDEDVEEDKMYEHELPPDPFAQKLTIEEEVEEEENYDDDFLEESHATSKATVSTSKATVTASEVTSLSSPIKVEEQQLMNVNSSIDVLVDQVKVPYQPLPSSSSVPVITTTSPISSPRSPRPDLINNKNNNKKVVMKTPRRDKNDRSPRPDSNNNKNVLIKTPRRAENDRSPRPDSNNKKNRTPQKLRQSPIRVDVNDNKVLSPRKLINKSIDYADHENDENEYDVDFSYEDDFVTESVHNGNEHVEEVMMETLDPLKEVNTEGDVKSNLIESSVEGKQYHRVSE